MGVVCFLRLHPFLVDVSASSKGSRLCCPSSVFSVGGRGEQTLRPFSGPCPRLIVPSIQALGQGAVREAVEGHGEGLKERWGLGD